MEAMEDSLYDALCDYATTNETIYDEVYKELEKWIGTKAKSFEVERYLDLPINDEIRSFWTIVTCKIYVLSEPTNGDGLEAPTSGTAEYQIALTPISEILEDGTYISTDIDHIKMAKELSFNLTKK